jgi:hypothetical protein
MPGQSQPVYGNPQIPSNVQPMGLSNGSFGSGVWPPPPATYYQPQPSPGQQRSWAAPSNDPLGPTPGGNSHGAATLVTPPTSDLGRFLDYMRLTDNRNRDGSHRDTRDFERLEAENRARALEEQLRRADLERKEIEHKAMLDRQSQQHAADLTAMREEMRRLAEQLARPAESDEIRRAREENARLERQREQDRQDLRFKEIHDNQARMQENFMRALEKLSEQSKKNPDDDRLRDMEQRLEKERQDRERQAEKERYEREREREKFERERDREKFEQQIAKMQHDLQNNRPDPMIEIMREQARAQADAARENVRAQELRVAEMRSLMVPPMDMIRAVKESSSGAEVMFQNIINAFSGVFATYKGAMESVMQIQAGGNPSPFVNILQQGLSDGKDMFEQWMQTKRDQAVAIEKTRQMEEQRRAVEAQASAQRGAWAPPPAVSGSATTPPQKLQQPTPPPGAQFTTQSGHVGPQNGQNGQPQQAETVDVSQIDPKKLPEHITLNDVKVLAHPAVIQAVSNLRKGVKAFIDANGKVDPKTGKHLGLDPEEAVNGILRGIMQVEKHKIHVPAFELLADQRYADMIDVLLPQAPPPYKQACVESLIQHLKSDVADVKDPEDPEDPEDAEDEAQP